QNAADRQWRGDRELRCGVRSRAPHAVVRDDPSDERASAPRWLTVVDQQLDAVHQTLRAGARAERARRATLTLILSESRGDRIDVGYLGDTLNALEVRRARAVIRDQSRLVVEVCDTGARESRARDRDA